jgi:hypothetical protein
VCSSDLSGNTLVISVKDTISDNNIVYFKVSFAERNRDTTDDWFRRSAAGTQYSTSLVGSYETFLPASFTAKNGSFKSSNGTITYSYLDSMRAGGTYVKRVMRLEYSNRILHGFDELDFADSLGIISLIDRSGRFPVTYTLDSASIDGRIYK